MRRYGILATVLLMVWLAGMTGPATHAGQGRLTLRVTGLTGTLSPIKLPVKGKLVDTGPISIALGPCKEVGYVDPATNSGVVFWPGRVSSPLLRELGLAPLDLLFVGVIDLGKGFSIDFSTIRLAAPVDSDITINNSNVVVTKSAPPTSKLVPAAQVVEGKFTSAAKVPYAEAERAFNIASQYMRFPLKSPGEFLRTSLDLHGKTGHEIVAYVRSHDESGVILDSYQTADLEGVFSIAIGQ